MSKVKILYFDIETSRMIVEFPTYSLYDNNRIHPKYIKEDWRVTSAAWGWLDNEKQKVSKIEVVSGLDFPSKYKKDYRYEEGIIKKVHKVLKEADVVVGHHVMGFDMKKINYKFMKYNLEPLEPIIAIDTLTAAKKYAKASSNSLYYLAKEFGVEMKIDLPAGTMHAADAGCEKSLKKLVRYNKGDIKAGAALYFKLLPYIKNHPNLNRIIGKQEKASPKEVLNCGSCGSDKIIRNGYRATKTGRKQRYYCQSCGSSTIGAKAS